MRPRARRYGPLGNQLVQSDLGRDDPPPVAPNKPPKGWEQRQAAAADQQTAVLNAWNQVAAHLGGLLDFAKAPPAGDVLGSGTRVIGSNGSSQIRFPLAFAALHIANLSPSVLTLAVGPAQQTAPASRGGVFMIPGGIARTLSTRDTVATIYGPAGSTFDFTAFSRPRDPISSIVAQGPGGGVLVPAGTTTTTTKLLTQQTFTRLVVVVNVAAVSGGTVTLVINGVTPSGYVYPLLDALAISAVGVTPLRIGPDLYSSPNAVTNDVVPELVQVVSTVSGTITYGVDFIAGR